MKTQRYFIDFQNFLDWVETFEAIEFFPPEKDIFHGYKPLNGTTISCAGDQVTGVSILYRSLEDYVLKILFPSHEVILTHTSISVPPWAKRLRHFNDSFRLFLFIPAYINATTFEIVKKKRTLKERLKGKGKGLASPYVIIRSVKRINIGEKTKGKGKPFEFQIPVRGFWRKVKGIGKDQNGKPVVGKTWVKSFTRNKDKPKRDIIYVKEPIRL